MVDLQLTPELPQGSSDSDRLQMLYAISAMLRQVEAGGLGMDAILPKVLTIAVEEIQGKTGSIIIANERREVEYFWHIDDSGQTQPREFLAEILSDGIAGKVIHSRTSILINDTTSDPRWLPRPDHPTTLAPWSAICVPLNGRDHAFGAITITKPGSSQFEEAELNLLETIASQAASTLENARLFSDSRQRASALYELVAATQAVSSSLLPAEVIRLVPQQMARLLHVSNCVLVRWDLATDRFVPWSAHPSMARLGIWKEAPWSRTVMASRQPTQRHLKKGDDGGPEQQWLLRNNAVHVLTVPLVAQGQVVALAHLLDDSPLRTFSEQETAMLQALANQAVVAIANARLYERTQRQLRESAFLNEAGAVVNSTLDIDEIMHALLDKTNEILNVEALSIAMLDRQTDELVYRVAVGAGSQEIPGMRLPAGEGISGWVLQHGEPALVPDAARDERHSQQGDARTNHKTLAIICAPLQIKGQVIGTIQAINPYVGPFTEDDLQLLVKLATLASSALDNAEQFARTQAAEARYLGLFEDSIDPIILTSRSGRILEANRRATEFLGYTKSELLELSIDMLHPEDPSLFDWRQLASLGDQVQVFKSHVAARDLTHIPVEVHAKRLLNGESEVIQWIHKDITDQVELEAMREDLMAMLFHDLQSPLSNVISGLELLEYELSPVEHAKALTILHIAARSSQRLANLIRSLLDISRLEAGHPITNQRPVSVASVVDNAMEAVEPGMSRRGIALRRDVDEGLPTIVVDQDMITRVLINLLDNALKYSNGGQAITVHASYLPTVDRVQLAIADQGPGIPETQRAAVFKKFYRLQAEGSTKGLGLGLAFCRMAVEGHGGRIWVEEAPGGGAMFSFTLPADTQDHHE